MEGAARVFAGEFNRSSLAVPADDDRSSSWVVTPSGAFCRQVFLAGALVDIREEAGMLSGRLADPTGGFDLACSGNNSSVAETFQRLPLPSLISLTGRAQLYRREGKICLTIRPEQVTPIDRTIRDLWVVTTATATLARLETIYLMLQGTCADDRIRRTQAHYALTKEDLAGLADMIAGALSSVRPAAETPVVADPRGLIMEYLRKKSGPRGVAVEEILEMARMKAVSRESALAAIESLVVEDECYQPQKGYIRPL